MSNPGDKHRSSRRRQGQFKGQKFARFIRPHLIYEVRRGVDPCQLLQYPVSVDLPSG